MRASIAALLLPLAACGGPNWKGLFDGAETVTATCSDGSGGSETDSSALDIGTSGSQIFWPTACGVEVQANTKGDTATIIPVTCQPQTSDGVTSTLSITGGTLTIDNDTITEDISATVTTAADGGESCSETLTGTFSRSTM